MNNAPYGKTIANVAQRTDICLLIYMEIARMFAEKPQCVDLRVFNGQMAPPEQKVESAVAEGQQRNEALVGIEMRRINHFINKLFVNGFCVLEYSKLKRYVTYLPCFDMNNIKTLMFLEIQIIRASQRRLR